MSSEMESLYGLVNRTLQRLKDRVVRRVRPAFLRLRRRQHKEKEEEEETTTTTIASVLAERCQRIQDELSRANYKRFCELLATALIREYVRAVLFMSSSWPRGRRVRSNVVARMIDDLDALTNVLERLPVPATVVKDREDDDDDDEKKKKKKTTTTTTTTTEDTFGPYYRALNATRRNIRRLFAVLRPTVEIEQFADAVRHEWRSVMMVPGSVTPSLLPKEELQQILRLKGASVESARVAMAELGLTWEEEKEEEERERMGARALLF